MFLHYIYSTQKEKKCVSVNMNLTNGKQTLSNICHTRGTHPGKGKHEGTGIKTHEQQFRTKTNNTIKTDFALIISICTSTYRWWRFNSPILDNNSLKRGPNKGLVKKSAR